MKTKKAEKLKVGSRVKFSDGIQGEVIQKGYCGVKIKWDDGQIGDFHFADFQEIEAAP